MAWIADAGVIEVAQQTCVQENKNVIKLYHHTGSGSHLHAVRLEPEGESRTGAPMRTLAEERGHAVVAGGAVVTSGAGAIVDVLAAVVTRPAVDADAVVAAVSVVARPSILAGVGHQLALIDIFRAVLTWKITGRLKEILQKSCLSLFNIKNV